MRIMHASEMEHVCMQGWLHSILYVLFENAMSVVKLWAVIAGENLAMLQQSQ